MTLKPIGDRLIVKAISKNDRKSTKWHMATCEADEYALVVGTPDVSVIHIGDKVLLPKYAGKKVKHGEDKLMIVDEKDVLAVIKGDN